MVLLCRCTTCTIFDQLQRGPLQLISARTVAPRHKKLGRRSEQKLGRRRTTRKQERKRGNLPTTRALECNTLTMLTEEEHILYRYKVPLHGVPSSGRMCCGVSSLDLRSLQAVSCCVIHILEILIRPAHGVCDRQTL